MNTQTKTLLTGFLASFALLALVASPSRAESHSQTANATTTSNTEQQISQNTAPSPQTQPQSDDKGCACCKKMMGNTQQMDHKMHQMMNGQQNLSK